MQSIEEQTGYHFQDPLLLAEALTHPSLAYETHRGHSDNQRLEFLGDAVLQLIFTHELFRTFTGFDEGNLTKLRSRLVSRAALAGYARTLQLGAYLQMGRGEEASGGRERASTLSDAFEALMGAIYLDSGMETVRAVVLRLCAGEFARICAGPPEVNPKGQLQEMLQALEDESPQYRILSEDGPDHRKSFVAEVVWSGQILGRGTGLSKKLAETAAAEAALDSESVKTLLRGRAADPSSPNANNSVNGGDSQG